MIFFETGEEMYNFLGNRGKLQGEMHHCLRGNGRFWILMIGLTVSPAWKIFQTMQIKHESSLKTSRSKHNAHLGLYKQSKLAYDMTALDSFNLGAEHVVLLLGYIIVSCNFIDDSAIV